MWGCADRTSFKEFLWLKLENENKNQAGISKGQYSLGVKRTIFFYWREKEKIEFNGSNNSAHDIHNPIFGPEIVSMCHASNW